MSPWLVLAQLDRVAGARGTVRFGRYFLGTYGAVHGGAFPLVFDEVLGRTARTAGRPSPGPPTYTSTTAR